MRFISPTLLMIVALTTSAGAATTIDPVLGNSPVAITNAEDKKALQAIDPILGDSPVARTERSEPEKLTTKPPAKPTPPKPPHHHKPHGNSVHYYITPAPTSVYPAAQPVTRSYGINQHATGERAVVDGQEYLLVNRWSGKCGNRNCYVSAGHLLGNEGKGALVVMNPYLNNGPLVFYPPSENGALQITRADRFKGQLTVQSQKGDTYIFNIVSGDWEF